MKAKALWLCAAWALCACGDVNTVSLGRQDTQPDTGVSDLEPQDAALPDAEPSGDATTLRDAEDEHEEEHEEDETEHEDEKEEDAGE